MIKVVQLYTRFSGNKPQLVTKNLNYYFITFLLLLIVSVSYSQDTCQNVIETTDTTNTGKIIPVFIPEGDKDLGYPSGDYDHSEKYNLTKESNLIKHIITRTFNDKRFNELVEADEQIHIIFWIDKTNHIVSARYRIYNFGDKEPDTIITKCDILAIDKKLKQLTIKIPPAFALFEFCRFNMLYRFY